MEQPAINRVKMELLKRIDALIRRQYEQPLSDFINELYVRQLSVKQYPTADEMFMLLYSNRILATIPDREAHQLHETIGNLKRGLYGQCSECHQAIDENSLMENPLEQLCTSCRSDVEYAYSSLLEAMKSVETFSW